MSAISYTDLTSALVPYSEKELTAAKILLAQTLLAILINIILILAICKERLHTMAIDTMFILSLVVADFLFALNIAVYCCLIISGEGWWMDKVGCAVNGAICIATVGLSILSLVGLTGFRYLSIIFKRQMTQQQAVKVLFGMWIAIPIIISIFFMFPMFMKHAYLAVQPSRLYCALEWWRTDHNTSAIGSVSICLIVIFSSIGFIIFAYTHICAKYIHWKRLKIMDALDSGFKNNTDLRIYIQMSGKEWLLIKKSLLISLSFLVVWAPYCVKILIEVLSANPSSYAFDTFTSWIACLNTLLNAWILSVYDGKTRSALVELMSPLLSFWPIARFRRASSATSSAPIAVNSTTQLTCPSLQIPNCPHQSIIAVLEEDRKRPDHGRHGGDGV